MDRDQQFNASMCVVDDKCLSHTWECIAMLEHYLDIKSYRPSHNNNKNTDFKIPEGDRRCAMYKNKSKNIVDRLYTSRLYTDNIRSTIRCVCDSINLYRDYILNHILTHGHESKNNNCACVDTCLSSSKIGCTDGKKIIKWIEKQLLLTDRMYCERHERYVHLQSDDSIIANTIYDTSCKSIINGVCYHTAILSIYKDRNNRTLYGSELHKALAAWVRYNEWLNDWSKRTVLVRDNNRLGIYHGFPD